MSQHDQILVEQQPACDQLTPRDAPPTPPSPDELDTDAKASRKREREVSLEPATPKTDESAPEDTQEHRAPAPKKKNRVNLESTKEEDETPPASPNQLSVEQLSTSPPYETKVRQISRKVRGMKWDDKERPVPGSSKDMQDVDTLVDVVEIETQDANVELEAPVEISEKERSGTPERAASTQYQGRPSMETQKDERPPPDSTCTVDSDSDDQEKGLKRKIDERQTSINLEEQHVQAGAEVVKRARDDNEEDDNPREKKRPTPDREEPPIEQVAEEERPTTPVPEPVAPQPKVGGFLSYASTASPFAAARGPSVFGQKSTPSPSPLAGTSNGSASSLSSAFAMKASSSFPIPIGKKTSSTSTSAFSSPSAFSPNSPNNLSTSPTGTKRSGFEAFASTSSPFAAAARSKSPSAGVNLSRSKSPTRRGTTTSINAFKSYIGSGTQGFSAPPPPVKKQRHDSGDDTENEKPGAINAPNSTSNGSSPEGSEEEIQNPSFAERLRAGHNALEGQEGSEDEEKVVATEQETQTGEEQEDTVFQVRGKLYALSDQNAWKERGTGLLKLNVRKMDGGGARLVMRKEAVFALLLNVTLFKGMRCTLAQDPRYVRFSCIESGKTVHYNLRLSNAKVADELIEEIHANIPSDEPDDAV